MHLGINLGHHDTSACVLTDDGELLVLEEERLLKAKHAGFYPFCSIDYIQRHFDVSALSPDQVAFTTFFTDLEQTWKHISTLKSKYALTFKKDEKLSEKNPAARRILHHEAHLFSALINLDPGKDYLIVISDGCGSCHTELEKSSVFPHTVKSDKALFESISIYSYSRGKIEVLDKILTPVFLVEGENHEFSPASHFTAASQVVFGDWNYSGKVMGMAGYFSGEPLSDEELFRTLTQSKYNEKSSKKYFDELDKENMDHYVKICGSTQLYFEKYMMNLFENLKRKNPSFDNLIYLGGTALNCIFNEKLRRKKLFKTIFVPAWTNDEGVGIGAAVGSYYLKHKKIPDIKAPSSPFLGPVHHYSEAQIKKAFEKYNITNTSFEEVAGLLAANQIVSIYEGRSECGPRALGHRSILCSPFIPGIRDYLNDRIKFREKFRPYGCSVLEEQQSEYFEDAEGLYSPYMSFAPVVKSDKREMLNEVKHADNTIRIQTVDETFPSLRKILNELKKKTGHSLVIHTSLNINKQPILETLEDAVKFFESSEIQFMLFENLLISKK